jgi:hypothetical protein
VANLDFTQPSLLEFLRYLASNFETEVIGSVSTKCGVFLRHDIDLDIAAAKQMGVLEASQGIKSSFYFRITGRTYNLFSKESSSALKFLDSLGHEIGLHFDPSVYENSEGTLNSRFFKEIMQLSLIVEKPILSYSIHNPSVSGIFGIETDLINCYDTRLFSRDNYLSDSRMNFLEDPYTFLKRRLDTVVQILLHPIHFSGDGTYADVLTNIIFAKVKDLESEMRENSTFLNSRINLVDEIHKRTKNLR